MDAGKTTLSEGILYLTGTTRKMGRVDTGDTFLDTDSMERARGITVFSKEARFSLGDLSVTLVDTPGHADFSAEMERSLAVLDLAVLVVSGAEGIQSHTLTLIRLFELYRIPFFVFVNKMDMPGTSKEAVLGEIRKQIRDAVDLSGAMEEIMASEDVPTLLPKEAGEEAATCSEKLMDEYVGSGAVSVRSFAEAVMNRQAFPVLFGSALKMQGVDSLLRALELFTVEKKYGDEFGALAYKITRDGNGNRLTHMKITGGALRNKMILETGPSGDGEKTEEKAEQIRLYNGDKFQTVNSAEAGTLCAVLGLKNTYGGQRLGSALKERENRPFIEPSLTYTLVIPEKEDPVPVLQKMRELEEEDPTLRFHWEERTKEIRVSVMGELEKDLLRYRIKDRFGLDCDFSKGKVIYKETVKAPVEGVGHYEPLRHYAEVRVLIEPLPEGSGLVFESRVPEDELAGNWQRLILKHLMEKRHKGTLTGAEITDMKISLIAGRAHLKHTEGGDFRQATYRAVRQGLRKALAKGDMMLLEPMYDFRVMVPLKYVGRVMTDMDRAGAVISLEESSDSELSVIRGRGPVSALSEYQMELNAFSEGQGRFEAVPGGYGPCHNEEEVVADSGYDCDSDLYNPVGSVFTDHGAGVYVNWDMVDEIAHTEGGLRGLKADLNSPETAREDSTPDLTRELRGKSEDKMLRTIFEKTYGKSKRDEQLLKEARSRATRMKDQENSYPNPEKKSKMGRARSYLVLDGYNVLFAWDEFRGLREANIDSARESFMDIMQNYQGYTGHGMTVVFDGYKVKGSIGSREAYGDISVVYTKEAETADRYIEELIFEKGREYDITVVTSDRPVQMSALGDGARRLSAREFHEEVMSTSSEIREKLRGMKLSPNRPFEEAFRNKR